MNKDKKIIGTVSLATFAILLIVLLLPINESKILTALLMSAMALIARVLIRKRSSVSINKKEVLLLSIIIAVLYVLLLQGMGIAFGFYKNPYFVNTSILIKTVIPVAAIIVSSEIFRGTMLAQKNTFASVFAFLSCLIAEVLTFSSIAQLTSFNIFMDLMGLHLLPAIGANLYYNYVSRRYGTLPNVIFRLITALYSYFMYKITATPDVIVAMIKLVVPVIMYALISALYEKKKKPALRKGSKLSVLGTILTSVVIVSIAMLIRALLSWFPMDENGKLTTFFYYITEPLIMPMRLIFDRFGWGRSSPMDLPFLVTSLELMLLYLIISML